MAPDHPNLTDPEYARFWETFNSVQALQRHGMVLQALNIVERLRGHKRKAEFDPHRNVDYSYAVLLQIVPGNRESWERSAEILRSLVEEEERDGEKPWDSALVWVELASALNLLGRYSEAAEIAAEAVKRAGERSTTAALGWQNIGRAQMEEGKLDAAIQAFLRMIDVGLEGEGVELGGIAAEWLSRIALRQGRPEVATAWASLAEDVYRSYAPHHLHTSADLRQSLASMGKTAAPLDGLPQQARAIRERVGASGDLGEWAGLRLDSLYVDLGALRLLADLPPDRPVRVTIPVVVPDPTVVRALGMLLVEEVNTLIPHARATDLLSSVLRDLWPDHARRSIDRMRLNGGDNWSLSPSLEGNLVFESTGTSAAAFGVALRELAILFQGAFESRRQRLAEAAESARSMGMDPNSLTSFVNLADRSWPTPVHLRLILHGQALASGGMGPRNLAEEIVRVRLWSPADNRTAFQKLNYSSSESDELHQGGMVALFASELIAPGGAPSFDIGTAPLNEFNLVNRPAKKADFNLVNPGCVLDREYNTWFLAPSASQPDVAVYGTNNELFRDHFSGFQAQVQITGATRAKHYAIPIVDVHSKDDLSRIVTLLNEAAERLKPTKHVEPEARVWYRGQTRGYQLRRTELVLRFLYGRSDVEEPSLPGASPRRGWNYHQVHSFLSTMLQALVYRLAPQRGERVVETYEKWRSFAENPGQWDLAVMALAQHYGIPTPGIDLTHDPDIALWFATNQYTPGTGGTATYEPLPPWPQAPDQWPVIYVVLPVTHSLKGAIRDIDLLEPLGVTALRPRRQKGAFFMGATGLHRNRLAEALVCILRLAPSTVGTWDTACTYRELFPPPEQDVAHAWIMDLKAKYRHGEIGKFLNEVPLYTYL